MSIAPNELTNAPSQTRYTQPIAVRPWPLETLDSSSPESTPSADVAAVAQPASGGQSQPTSMTKLIAQLSRQLKSIEQTFMRELQSLVRSANSASAPASSAAAPANGSSQASAPNPYDGLIRRTAARHELDPALLGAVIRQESGFNPSAQSSAGAMGLMQLMPDTARSLGVTDPYDPAQNVQGGARMLRGL